MYLGVQFCRLIFNNEPGSVSLKQTSSTAQTTTGVLLYVGLILVVMIIILSVAVLIFCRRRASKPKGEAAGNTHT